MDGWDSDDEYSKYREIPFIRPPMVLDEGGPNSEHVSLVRHIYIEKCILVLIARVVLILSGLCSRILLFLEYMLQEYTQNCQEHK